MWHKKQHIPFCLFHCSLKQQVSWLLLALLPTCRVQSGTLTVPVSSPRTSLISSHKRHQGTVKITVCSEVGHYNVSPLHLLFPKHLARCSSCLFAFSQLSAGLGVLSVNRGENHRGLMVLTRLSFILRMMPSIQRTSLRLCIKLSSWICVPGLRLMRYLPHSKFPSSHIKGLDLLWQKIGKKVGRGVATFIVWLLSSLPIKAGTHVTKQCQCTLLFHWQPW